MLAPIVTKEMKLFPSQPLPSRIKNVRSRAQSLQDFANGNAIHVASSTTTQQTASNIVLNPSGGRAARNKNSRSIGSLPTNSVLATGFQQSANPNILGVPTPTAKTPPKYSTSSASLRKPLDSITEGVELSQGTSGGSGISSNSSNPEKRQNAKEQQPKKLAKEDGGSKKNPQPAKNNYSLHRSSHDGLSVKSTKMAAENNRRAQRTHSMEGGRKKRNESRASGGGGGNSSSATGCFAMWLSSKFRKSGSGDSTESNTSTTVTAPAAEEEKETTKKEEKQTKE